VGHFIRLVFTLVFSAITGWIALFGLNALKVLQTFEAFEAAGPNVDMRRYVAQSGEIMRSLESGAALLIGTSIACIVLSEIVGTRSLLYYAGAAGALTVILAVGLSPPPAGFGQALSALAIAGFISGAVYWLFAGRVAR